MKIAEKIESDMGKQDAQSARSSLSDLADAINELKQELSDRRTDSQSRFLIKPTS